jgi:hypothetical protein
LLAQCGRDVVIVDKERPTRFDIGDSLLPMNVARFEQLGLKRHSDAIGMPKFGIELHSPHYDAPVSFDFADQWDKTHPSSYRMRRSESDQVLFENAQN